VINVGVQGATYRMYGYKGKQVRDNIHSDDVACAIQAIYENPRPGEVYNLGGGRENSCSIIEAFERVEALTGKRMRCEYVDTAREGDHICYISDLRRLRSHYPEWTVPRSLDAIVGEIAASWEGGR